MKAMRFRTVGRGRTRGAAVGAILSVGVLALAACGSSSSSGTGAPPTSEAPSSSNAPSTTMNGATGATVSTVNNPQLGTILVDSQGRTLYTLMNNGKPVACTGQCLSFWPPLLLSGGETQVTPGKGVTGLATASVSGGTQVTENGAPLHRFSGDTGAGQANGDGVVSFGGTWHVVKATASSGGANGSVPPTTAPSSSTTNGYGY